MTVTIRQRRLYKWTFEVSVDLGNGRWHGDCGSCSAVAETVAEARAIVNADVSGWTRRDRWMPRLCAGDLISRKPVRQKGRAQASTHKNLGHGPACKVSKQKI
jgi:hypothetical protein